VTVEGSVEIDAPVARVWHAVTDFGFYPQWNPWIVRLDGEAKEGSKLTGTIRMEGRKDSNIRSVAIKVETGKEMLLKTVVFTGLLGDNHRFRFESLGTDRTRFHQSVTFHGILSPFIGGVVKDNQIALERMNAALKGLCESK
jgi:hypothetical protein